MTLGSRIIAIVGPTASGKTGLSLRLAKQYDGQIVCADSRTIYRGMDIGTAKPTASQRSKVKHHLLDIKELNETFSAKDFCDYAQAAINAIREQSSLPLVAGGSGLYIDSLLRGYTFRSDRPDFALNKYADFSLNDLLVEAQKLYGEVPSLSDQANRRRLLQFIARGPVPRDQESPAYSSIIVGLNPGREVLQQRIAQRTAAMLGDGLIDEVRDLRDRYGAAAPALGSTGYRQVIDYLAKNLEESDLPAEINRVTWQLARKQLTWFRRNPEVYWFEDSDEAYTWLSPQLNRRGDVQ